MRHHTRTVRSLLLASALALLPVTVAVAEPAVATSQIVPSAPVRERINIGRDWRFALGDANDPARDFGYGTASFFFAKAGAGDGPASVKFVDRAWRRLDLPND